MRRQTFFIVTVLSALLAFAGCLQQQYPFEAKDPMAIAASPRSLVLSFRIYGSKEQIGAIDVVNASMQAAQVQLATIDCFVAPHPDSSNSDVTCKLALPPDTPVPATIHGFAQISDKRGRTSVVSVEAGVITESR